jgi:hypothetical protein
MNRFLQKDSMHTLARYVLLFALTALAGIVGC